MARPSTRTRVLTAALELIGEVGYAGLTMEGIAARAGAGKQTLYRTWPGKGAIVFDALLDRSVDPAGAVAVPDSGDLAADLELLVAATIADLLEPGQDRLLRAMMAEVQTDPALADELRDRLLGPQLAAVAERLRVGGVEDPEGAVELLYGPILHRWLLRTGPFGAGWAAAHVRRVLRAVGRPTDQDH
ncbi:TetR/AcrR family transcriptional regulator [Microlunatus speluncae]|uniref:TetR/AcrR family transcriptional regulator n=1 Tax=Microlunatus speluncae TaxID=2594267 RepID=UPI00126633A8|nr:TetR/AcrR family transcriptional regulator [Microlunatus speluncae]